jgi:hypothetical protein
MRRLKNDASPFARDLLTSVDADRPESGACDRALGALGLGTAGVATASTAAKAAAVAGSGAKGAGATSLPPATAKAGALLWAKWIGLGVLGTSIAIGSAQYVWQAVASPAPDVRAPDIAHSDPGTPSPSPIPPPLAQIDPPEVTPAATVPRANGRGRPRQLVSSNASPNAASEAGAPAAATSLSAADSVTTQLEALSDIRAIERYAPEHALELLDGFERRYPSSPLQEEVAVLRVDALVDTGRGAEATTLANAFLVAHPASAYAQRVLSKVKTQ